MSIFRALGQIGLAVDPFEMWQSNSHQESLPSECALSSQSSKTLKCSPCPVPRFHPPPSCPPPCLLLLLLPPERGPPLPPAPPPRPKHHSPPPHNASTSKPHTPPPL